MTMISMSFNEAINNIGAFHQHEADRDAINHQEYGFGVWRWGHSFVRLEKNDRLIYKIFFSILSKLGLILTEHNGAAYIQRVEDASLVKAAPLFNKQRESLEERVGKLERDLQQVSSAEGQLQEELEQSKTEIKGLKTAIGERDERINSLVEERTKSLEENRQKLVDANSTNTRLLRNIEVLTNLKTQNEESLRKGNEDLTKANADIAKLKEEIKTNDPELLKKQKNSFETQNENLKDKVKNLEQEITTLQDQLKDQVTKFKDRIVKQEDFNEKLAEENKELQKRLTANEKLAEENKELQKKLTDAEEMLKHHHHHAAPGNANP